MNPVIIQLGPFQVTWYGLMIVFGAVLAAWISTIEAKRRGENPEHVWNMLAWILIFGIIGARLYHVFSNPVGGIGWSYYREHPIEIINFWSGGFRGLGIFGALLGGLIAVFLYIFYFNHGLKRRLAEATALLQRLAPQVGSDLAQRILGADISTIPGLSDQQERVVELRTRLRKLDGCAARLSELAPVFAEKKRLLGDGYRKQNLAEASALLQTLTDVAGSDLATGILEADLSHGSDRQVQKERVAQLKQRLASVADQGAIRLEILAKAFADRNLRVIRWLDILTPGILLAQAVGRMGNRINQELYGPPTTLPWGFKINPNFPFMPPLTRPPDVSMEDYIAVTRFHPTFYYEAIWNLVGFALVMIFGRRWYKRLLDGDIFLFYLIWYPLGRFLVEMFRPDAWISGFGGLATAQVISIALLITSSVILVFRHVRSRGSGSAGGDGEVPVASDAPANPGDDNLERLTDESL